MIRRFFRRWIQRRQRQIDIEILWPAILEKANDIEHAKTAFISYAVEDPAWCALSRAEFDRAIAALEGKQP